MGPTKAAKRCASWGNKCGCSFPRKAKIKEFFADFAQFPHQMGSSLNAGAIGYGLVRQEEALNRLGAVERFATAGGAR